MKPKILALVAAFLTLTAGFSYPTKTSANWNGDVLVIAAADEDDEDEDDDDDGGGSSYQRHSYSPAYAHYSSVTTRRPVTTRQTRKIHHRKPITHKRSTKRNAHSVTNHRHASTSHSTKKANVAKKRVQPQSNQAANSTHRLRSVHKLADINKALHQPNPDKALSKDKPSRVRKSARTTDTSLKENKTSIQIQRSQRTGMRPKTSGKNERSSTSPNAKRNPSARVSKQPSRSASAHSVSSKANPRTPKKAVNQGKAQRTATHSGVNRVKKTPKPSPVAGSKTGQASPSKKDVNMPVKPSRLDASPKLGGKAKHTKSATKKSRNQ